MSENNLSSISRADSYEKMGEFWDTHDFTEFADPNAPDVEFEITGDALRAEVQRKAAKLVGVPREQLAAEFLQLADKLRAEAIAKGIAIETEDNENQLPPIK